MYIIHVKKSIFGYANSINFTYNMKQFILIIITLSLVLLGCTRKQEYKHIFYYPSGKVKKEAIYASEKEMELQQNYSTISYYENGNVETKQIIRNGMREGGAWLYYEDGNIKCFQMYEHDTLHGIYRKYDIDGKQISESCYLNGVRVIFAEITYEDDISYYRYYMYTKDSMFYLYGHCAFDKNKKIIEELSHGSVVISKDTIDEGNPSTVEIKLLNLHKQIYNERTLRAAFGEYEYTEVQGPSFNIVSAENNKIEYSFYPSQSGYIFLIGKLYYKDKDMLKQDEVTLMCPFYKLFYVRGKDER